MSEQAGREILAECRLLTRDCRLQHGYSKEVQLAQARLKRFETDYAVLGSENRGLRDEIRGQKAELEVLKRDNQILRQQLKGLQDRQANEAQVLGTRNAVIETIRKEAAQNKAEKEEMEAEFASYKEKAEVTKSELQRQLIEAQNEIAKLLRRVEETERLGVASQLEAKLLNDWRSKSSMMFAERNDYNEGKMRKLQSVNKRLSTQIQTANENVSAYVMNTRAGMAQFRGEKGAKAGGGGH